MSRWSGTLLGLIYGYLIYLYLTYLILNGPPFTLTQKDNRTEVHYFNSSHIKLENEFDKQHGVHSCEFEIVSGARKKLSNIKNDTSGKKKKNMSHKSNSFDYETEFKKYMPLMTIETR